VASEEEEEEEEEKVGWGDFSTSLYTD